MSSMDRLRVGPAGTRPLLRDRGRLKTRDSARRPLLRQNHQRDALRLPCGEPARIVRGEADAAVRRRVVAERVEVFVDLFAIDQLIGGAVNQDAAGRIVEEIPTLVGICAKSVECAPVFAHQPVPGERVVALILIAGADRQLAHRLARLPDRHALDIRVHDDEAPRRVHPILCHDRGQVGGERRGGGFRRGGRRCRHGGGNGRRGEGNDGRLHRAAPGRQRDGPRRSGGRGREARLDGRAQAAAPSIAPGRPHGRGEREKHERDTQKYHDRTTGFTH